MGKEKSKLGRLIKEKGLTQIQFAEMVFQKRGYFIAPTNLSNYCSGYKTIKKIETAKIFAEVLEVQITDIL
jgi:transcriptional regulator with XRE-family HTH domain